MKECAVFSRFCWIRRIFLSILLFLAFPVCHITLAPLAYEAFYVF